MLRKLMPARDDARADDDSICDLDIILSRRVTFTYHGRARALLPITTLRLMQFWSASQDFRSAKHDSPEAANRGFLGILKTVCDDITLEDVSTMSIVPKGNLMEHLVRKITGQEPLTDSVKKKVIEPPSELVPLIS